MPSPLSFLAGMVTAGVLALAGFLFAGWRESNRSDIEHPEDHR